LTTQLTQQSKTNGIVTFTGSATLSVAQVVTDMNLKKGGVSDPMGGIKLISYDSNPIVYPLFDNGKLFASLDSQDYLSVYMATVMANVFVTTRQKLSNPMVSTGPVVLSENPNSAMNPSSTTASPTSTATAGSVGSASSTSSPSTSTRSIYETKIDIIIHGQAADGFWAVWKTGVQQAAADFQLKFVDCSNPVTAKKCTSNAGLGSVAYYAPGQEFDLATMAVLIDQAVSSAPNAMVVSIASSSLGPSILGGTRKGIPCISVNTGYDLAASFGMLTHVGQLEFVDGASAGKSLAAAGVRKLVCLNTEQGNAGMDLKCAGAASGFGEATSTPKTLGSAGCLTTMRYVSVTDLAQTIQVLHSIFQTDPTVNGLYVAGNSVGGTVVDTLKEMGLLVKGSANYVFIGQMDFNDRVLSAVQSGDILFAIQQQQYLQGYVPVMLHFLQEVTGQFPLEPFINTGSAYVTAQTIPFLRCVDAPLCEPDGPIGANVGNATALSLENCPLSKRSMIADGWCDWQANTAYCQWDGGDCCSATCVNPSPSASTDFVYACGKDAFNAGVNHFQCKDPSQQILPLRTQLFVLSPVIQTIIFTLTGIVCAVQLAFALFIILNRSKAFLRASSVPFSLAILSFLLLMPLASVFFALSPERGTYVCSGRAWFLGSSVAGSLAALLVKTTRIYKIFYNDKLKVSIFVKDSMLFSLVFLLVFIECILLIGLSASKISVPVTISSVSNSIMLITWKCSSDSSDYTAWIIIQMLFSFSFLFSCVYVAFKIRNLHADWNEGGQIANACFAFAILAITIIPMQWIVDNNPDAILFLRGIGLNVTALSISCSLFAPKVYYYMTNVEKWSPPHTLYQSGMRSGTGLGTGMGTSMGTGISTAGNGMINGATIKPSFLTNSNGTPKAAGRASGGRGDMNSYQNSQVGMASPGLSSIPVGDANSNTKGSNNPYRTLSPLASEENKTPPQTRGFLPRGASVSSDLLSQSSPIGKAVGGGSRVVPYLSDTTRNVLFVSVKNPTDNT
jgi:simple sugar transport system substrate-binding protein